MHRRGRKTDIEIFDEDTEINIITAHVNEIIFEQKLSMSFPVLYKKVFDMLKPPLQKGEAVYSVITNTIKTYVQNVFIKSILSGSSDTELLQLAKVEWDKLETAMNLLLCFSPTIDLLYATENDKEKVEDHIRDCVRAEISSGDINPLIPPFLGLVERDRCGETVERKGLLAISKMYFDQRTLQYYEEAIEKELLPTTSHYYETEAEQKRAETDGEQYINYAYSRAQEEVQRSKDMFLESTLAKTTSVTVAALMERFYNDLITTEKGLISMLEKNEVENISKAHYLYNNLKGGLDVFISVVDGVIQREGDVCNEITDPQSYIERVMELRVKYKVILDFINDAKVGRAIDKSFIEFLDRNEDSSNFLVDFSNTHFVRLFRKMDPKAIDSILAAINDIMKLIPSKIQHFEANYKRELSTRLLRGWTASLKHESNFLTKVKKDTSPQFSHSCEKMLRDIFDSAELKRGFLKPTNLVPLAFSAIIITRSLWPSQNYSFCEIPDEMHAWKDTYFKYWKDCKADNSPSDKIQIIWQPKLGFCVIEASIGNSTYTVKLSTYQFSILEKFNDRDAYSLTDLQNVTGLSKSELDKELFVLERYKILVNNGGHYIVNQAFSSRSKAFEIMPITRSSVDKKKHMIEKLDAYRRDLIEAATVRVLKKNEVMSRSNLINGVIEALSGSFNANKQIVEMRLNVLIEQGYMTEAGHILTYKP